MKNSKKLLFTLFVVTSVGIFGTKNMSAMQQQQEREAEGKRREAPRTPILRRDPRGRDRDYRRDLLRSPLLSPSSMRTPAGSAARGFRTPPSHGRGRGRGVSPLRSPFHSPMTLSFFQQLLNRIVELEAAGRTREGIDQDSEVVMLQNLIRMERELTRRRTSPVRMLSFDSPGSPVGYYTTCRVCNNLAGNCECDNDLPPLVGVDDSDDEESDEGSE